MAKKRFSSGLDDLFAADTHEPIGVVEGSDMTEMTVQRPPDRRGGVKSFATDLDALLQEAMEESLDQAEQATTEPTATSGKSKTRQSLGQRMSSGIDALIRQTLDVQEYTRDEETGVRRLTVAVDRSKLEKLKTIARMENAFLKDLLVGLIDEYIVEYTKDKGIKL